METPQEQSLKKEKPAKPQLRIGDILVQEGFVTLEDVKNALSIQQKEKDLTRVPLGKILVNMGILSEDDLESALQNTKLKKNLGSHAVEEGFITKEELIACLKVQKPGQYIGDVLIANGLLQTDEIEKVLKSQINSPKLGELLIEQKLITDAHLREAIKIQKSPRNLGEILVDLNLIRASELNHVLTKYNKQIGVEEFLFKLGFIDQDQLNETRREAEKSQDSIEEMLIKKNIVTKDQLQCALAKQYNLTFDSLEKFVYSAEEKKRLSTLISKKYAEKNLVLALRMKGKKLAVAIYNPRETRIITDLRGLYPELEIECIITTQAKFSELFEVLYSTKIGTDVENDVDEVDEGVDFMELNLNEELDEDGGPAYATKDIEAEEIVNFIIKYGILNGASDIHVEQDRGGVKLRYRIDGMLQEPDVAWLKQKVEEKVNAIVSRIKVMSNLDIAERRVPQDGVFRLNYFDKETNSKFDLDFRVATCRALTGENVIIRILDSRSVNVELENLNHSNHVVAPFKRLLKSSAGMILVTGPTGSGKSSTLYGALRYVYDPTIKIITAEDPVEYSFPGIMQTQIHTKINLTFSKLLRSFLRCDPDVILVGEIRDNETASISFDAAQTGHLLLSTLHTNDSIGAIQRLMDLKIDKTQVASCILAILAQRLIRKLCPFCKKEHVPGEDEWGILFNNYPSQYTFYTGEGCKMCNYTGFKGRVLLSEVFVMDKELAMSITQGASIPQIKKMAIESGMKTMLDDGLMKLEDTTLGEILRVIPHEMIEVFRSRRQAQQQADDLIDQLMGGATADPDPKVFEPSSYMVSDPGGENDLVNTMLEKYNNLRSALDSNLATIDASVFQEIITESFQNICEQYKCSNVKFTIEDKDDRAEISAIPVP
ncbi:MAG: Flp pilus assembly complex ATPase component TadA [Desulfobacterales bacterium]|nr:Flp pilus assembly complex ATPase component TadA [Desulfobacterales bacterium]